MEEGNHLTQFLALIESNLIEKIDTAICDITKEAETNFEKILASIKEKSQSLITSVKTELKTTNSSFKFPPQINEETKEEIKSEHDEDALSLTTDVNLTLNVKQAHTATPTPQIEENINSLDISQSSDIALNLELSASKDKRISSTNKVGVLTEVGVVCTSLSCVDRAQEDSLYSTGLNVEQECRSIKHSCVSQSNEKNDSTSAVRLQNHSQILDEEKENDVIALSNSDTSAPFESCSLLSQMMHLRKLASIKLEPEFMENEGCEVITDSLDNQLSLNLQACQDEDYISESEIEPTDAHFEEESFEDVCLKPFDSKNSSCSSPPQQRGVLTGDCVNVNEVQTCSDFSEVNAINRVQGCENPLSEENVRKIVRKIAAEQNVILASVANDTSGVGQSGLTSVANKNIAHIDLQKDSICKRNRDGTQAILNSSRKEPIVSSLRKRKVVDPEHYEENFNAAPLGEDASQNESSNPALFDSASPPSSMQPRKKQRKSSHDNQNVNTPNKFKYGDTVLATWRGRWYKAIVINPEDIPLQIEKLNKINKNGNPTDYVIVRFHVDGYYTKIPKSKIKELEETTSGDHLKGKKGAEKLEEPNEWCNVCHNGGDLFCCERCPRVYHLDCYVPPLKEEPPDDWTCLMCTTKDEFQKMSNSKPDDEEIPTLGERDLQVCRRVLLELYGCWPDCNSFSSVKELDFPQYHQLIKEPIALDVIKKHLGNNSAKHYKSTTKFLSDIRRMFKNCKTFWANFTGGEKYIGQAKKLEDIFINKWKELQKTTHKPIKVVAAGVSKKNNFTKHMSQTKSVSGRKRTAKMTIVYDQAQDAVASKKKRTTNNSQQSFFQGKELEIIELDCDEDNDQDPLNITIEEQSTNKPNDKQISNVNSNIDFEIPDFMTLVTDNGDETGIQWKPKPGPACSKSRKHKKPGPASTKRKARRNSMSYQEESLVLVDDKSNQNFEQVSQDSADPVQFESLKKDNNNQMVPISFSKGEKDIVTEDSLIEYVNDSKFSTNNFAISPLAFQKYENSICEEDMDDYSEFSSLPLNSNM